MGEVVVGRRGRKLSPTALAVAAYARFVGMIDRERGATATEYAILVSFIAVVLVAGVMFFGQNLDGWFHRLGAKVQPYTS